MARSRSVTWWALAVWAALLAVSPAPAWGADPELPRVFINTALAPPTGTTIVVGAGGDFQAALNAAQPGDVITLQAGATYTGSFLLPNKTGTGWITIRTSADGSLPPPGTRVTPANAGVMPKLVGPGQNPVVRALAGAHHFRFIGIEFRPAAGVSIFNLIELGVGNETNEADLPHDIIFDRSYIHGDPAAGGRRGISLNGKATAVIDSYLADFKDTLAEEGDAQALAGWNGSGPFKIVNNYLEGAAENVIFGGADPRITNLVPSDIEIRHNHFFKPLSWRIGNPAYTGTPRTVKNLLELKNARRVLIEGNIFEHSWTGQGQDGFAVLFTVKNQQNTAPWSVVEDVTFRRNIVRKAGSGVYIIGFDSSVTGGSQQTKRILMKDNLFDGISGVQWGGDGKFLVMTSGFSTGARDVTLDHNTVFQEGSIVAVGTPGSTYPGFVFTNNIAPHNSYGIIGDGLSPGNTSIQTYFPDGVIAGDVLAGPWPTAGGVVQSDYSAFSLLLFAGSLDAVGFVNRTGGNYRLAASSPYKNGGTDARDPGADIDALEAATAGVESGVRDVTPPSAPTNLQVM